MSCSEHPSSEKEAVWSHRRRRDLLRLDCRSFTDLRGFSSAQRYDDFARKADVVGESMHINFSCCCIQMDSGHLGRFNPNDSPSASDSWCGSIPVFAIANEVYAILDCFSRVNHLHMAALRRMVVHTHLRSSRLTLSLRVVQYIEIYCEALLSDNRVKMPLRTHNIHSARLLQLLIENQCCHPHLLECIDSKRH